MSSSPTLGDAPWKEAVGVTESSPMFVHREHQDDPPSYRSLPMMTTLENLPTDVLLYLSSCLTLADLLRFLSTCSTFRKISHMRSVWITALEQTRAKGHIACPIHSDLSRLDLPSLRRIAWHTHRLARNWSQSHPRILGIIKSVSVESNHNAIVAAIPGTHIVLCSDRSGSDDIDRLSCYDFQASPQPASLRIGIWTLEAHYDQCGRHLMAVLAQSFDLKFVLKVLSVEYGPERETMLQEIYQYPVGSEKKADYHAVFVSPNIVGTIFSDEDTKLRLLAVDMTTNASVELPVLLEYPIPPNFAMHCSVLAGDTLYFAIEATTEFEYHIYHINIPTLFASTSLPLGDDGEGGALPVAPSFVHDAYVDFTPDDWGGLAYFDFVVHFGSEGLTLSYTRYPKSYHGHITTTFHFAPNNNNPAHPSLMSDPSPITSLTIPGQIVHSAPSGTYRALLMDVSDQPETEGLFAELRLIQFVRDPIAQVRICTLRIPFYINLDEAVSVAIDDYCGVVFVLHKQGFLFALPYA